MNSAPWGTATNIVSGETYPVFDFATHKRFLQSTDDETTTYIPEAHDGGYPDGNIYSKLAVPKDIVGQIGLVIGREGKNFINITKRTGIIALWYEPSTGEIEIISGDTWFYQSEDSHAPGYFDFPDDIPDDEEIGDILKGSLMVEHARRELNALFEKTRSILYHNYLREQKTNILQRLMAEADPKQRQLFREELAHLETLLRIPY